MAVLRLDRFIIDPADGAELLSRHAALVAVAKDAFPGLLGVELAKVDDQTWIDVWRWDSLASAQAAVAICAAVCLALIALLALSWPHRGVRSAVDRAYATSSRAA